MPGRFQKGSRKVPERAGWAVRHPEVWTVSRQGLGSDSSSCRWQCFPCPWSLLWCSRRWIATSPLLAKSLDLQSEMPGLCSHKRLQLWKHQGVSFRNQALSDHLHPCLIRDYGLTSRQVQKHSLRHCLELIKTGNNLNAHQWWIMVSRHIYHRNTWELRMNN